MSRRGFLESAGAFALAGCATGAAPKAAWKPEIAAVDVMAEAMKIR